MLHGGREQDKTERRGERKLETGACGGVRVQQQEQRKRRHERQLRIDVPTQDKTERCNTVHDGGADDRGRRACNRYKQQNERQ